MTSTGDWCQISCAFECLWLVASVCVLLVTSVCVLLVASVCVLLAASMCVLLVASVCVWLVASVCLLLGSTVIKNRDLTWTRDTLVYLVSLLGHCQRLGYHLIQEACFDLNDLKHS